MGHDSTGRQRVAFLDQAVVLDEGELETERSANRAAGGYAAAVVSEFMAQSEEVRARGLHLPVKVFGVTANGDPRTANQVATNIANYTKTRNLPVSAQRSTTDSDAITLFEVPREGPPKEPLKRGRRPKSTDEQKWESA